jgi:hypothetical protein
VILFLALLVQLWKQQILPLPGRKWTAGWWDSASRWWSFHRRKAFGFQAFGNPSRFHTFTIILKGPHEPMHHPNISRAGNASISQQSEMFEPQKTSDMNDSFDSLQVMISSYLFCILYQRIPCRLTSPLAAAFTASTFTCRRDSASGTVPQYHALNTNKGDGWSWVFVHAHPPKIL